MRKRLLTLVLVGLLMFATACGSNESADSGSNETTTTASYNTKNAMGFEKAATAEYSTESNAELAPEQAAEDDFELAEEQAVEGDLDLVEEQGSEKDADLAGYDTSRKLVYNAQISLESKKFDEDIAAVKELVTTNGGYFESTSTNGSKENGNRWSSFSARIPAEKYDAFMNSVGEVGSVTYKSENIEDITASYVDVQARLKSLNTKLERLQELEANAENVTELLEIEDRINEVQYQLESYTAQMKTYDNQVDYSTVNIDITEVATYTEIKADSAWNRFVGAFQDSFVSFVSFIQEFVIRIIYILPYFIIIVIIILIIVLRRKKRKKAGKAKMLQSSQTPEEAEDNKE